MQVSKAASADYSAIGRQYRQWGERVKCGKRDHVYTLVASDASLLAAARVLPVADSAFLLRNLAVVPELRRQGLARQLMQAILNDGQVQPLYCYALDYLQAFYTSLGFATLQASEVPTAIAEPYQRYRANGKTFVLMGFNIVRGHSGV